MHMYLKQINLKNCRLVNIAYHIIIVTVGPIQCMKKSISSVDIIVSCIMFLHKHVKLADVSHDQVGNPNRKV
jgi:hypothetical protein